MSCVSGSQSFWLDKTNMRNNWINEDWKNETWMYLVLVTTIVDDS